MVFTVSAAHPEQALTGLSLESTARQILWLMLIATAIWPLFPEWLERSIRPPFGLRQWELSLVAIAGFLAYLVRVARRSGVRRLMADGIFTLLAVLSFAVVLGVIMERSGNGYFTADALAEGLVALLGAHIAAIWLRAFAGGGTGSPTLSQRIADAVLTGIAMLLLGFWILATLGLHIAAGILLLFAAGSYIVVILFLAPHAAAGIRPLVDQRLSQVSGATRRVARVKR